MRPFPGPRPFLSRMHHSFRRCLAYVPEHFRMNGRRKVLSCFPDSESILRISVSCSASHSSSRKRLRGSLRRSRAAFPEWGVSSSSTSKASPPHHSKTRDESICEFKRQIDTAARRYKITMKESKISGSTHSWLRGICISATTQHRHPSKSISSAVDIPATQTDHCADDRPTRKSRVVLRNAISPLACAKCFPVNNKTLTKMEQNQDTL